MGDYRDVPCLLQRHVRLILAVVVSAGGGLLGVGCPEAPQMPAADGVLWLQFAQISDTHLLDDESPARVVRLTDLSPFAWRPQDAYTAQVLDATLRVLNDYHTGALLPQHKLDFVMHTGDTVDNAQYNELAWFMTVMDGGTLTPDSGALDGAERPGAPEDNPKLAFQAAGLLPEIPWYVAYGNHDALCVGCLHIAALTTDPANWVAPLLCPEAAVLGLHRLGLNSLLPTADVSPAIITGSLDVANPDTMRLEWELVGSGTIPRDRNRHFIDADRFVAEHFNSVTHPAGHGLVPGAPLRYSLRPKADVPIRLVVLDTNLPSLPDGIPAAHGAMPREQFDHFLKPAFAAALAAGEWVLLATHHPSADFDIPYSAGMVGTHEFRKYLASQPNMIVHICGDTHRNHLEMIPGDYPYAEIETGSLIDYPQEARIIGLYYIAETRNFRVQSTMVSHMDAPTRLSAESFRRASLVSGIQPDPAAFTERFNMAPEDLFPADSEAAKGVAEGRVLTKDEAHGRDVDREFSFVLPRNPALR